MAKKMKICTKCGKVKPLSEYSKDKAKKDGLKTQCKDCMHAANAEWREERRKAAKKGKAVAAKQATPVAKRGKVVSNPVAKPAKKEKSLLEVARQRREEVMKATVLFSRIASKVYDVIAETFGLEDAEVQVFVKAKTTKKK